MKRGLTHNDPEMKGVWEIANEILEKTGPDVGTFLEAFRWGLHNNGFDWREGSTFENERGGITIDGWAFLGPDLFQ